MMPNSTSEFFYSYFQKISSQQHAFTLIEMMIALGILSILLLTAMPNVNYWQAKTEATIVASTLHRQMQTAREIAITRGTTTSLCGSNAQGVCQSQNFDALQIFIDNNKNKVRDSDEELISTLELRLAGQLRLNNHTSLQFKSDGTTSTPASFIYCPAMAHTQLIQRITLSFTGRTYVAQHNAQNIIKNASGNPIACTNWP